MLDIERVIVLKLVVENVERLFESVFRVPAPMNGLLVDSKVDNVLDILENENLAGLLIVRYEFLN